MKRLAREFALNPLELFFEQTATNDEIRQWVENNLTISEFNLNEPMSCKVTQFKDNITIRGDEDLVLLSIVTVYPKIINKRGY